MDMISNELIRNKIQHSINQLIKLQEPDGSWKFCFEGGLITDAFMIILLRSLNITNEEELIYQLAKRISTLQSSDGAWRAYPDERKGNLSTTVQAYTALLYSGYYSNDHPKIKAAEKYIQENGGLANTHFMTKWMLAVNGLYPWPPYFYIPMTFLLIPPSFPLNFFQFSTYARIHFIPMIIAANKRYTIRSKNKPNLERLNSPTYLTDSKFSSTYRDLHRDLFISEVRKLRNLPAYLHRIGYEQAERFMLTRIENDGTLYSYATATIFMVYGLLALGYGKRAPVILRAIEGLKNLISRKCGHNIHLENSTSTIWDTALISYTLQEANVPITSDVIKKSTHYLLVKQQNKKGDWTIHNPNIRPGGWGFSHNNTLNPDNDDTSVALRALTRRALLDKTYSTAWYNGVMYLLSMQNSDGGWAAFEKNTNMALLTYIPLDNAKDAAIDPSTADLTGRTLEFLGNFAGLTTEHPSIGAAVSWLLKNQEENGSWYGRWGVCYIYGTWAAITGLVAVGVSIHSPAIKKAVNWLESVQNSEGGWGESCVSSEMKRYIPLKHSTPSQTAWAVDALIQSGRFKKNSVYRGITYLLKATKQKKELGYPTGIGLPGQFYINYHSYNYIFPLLALTHYQQINRKFTL